MKINKPRMKFDKEPDFMFRTVGHRSKKKKFYSTEKMTYDNSNENVSSMKVKGKPGNCHTIHLFVGTEKYWEIEF